MQGKEIALIFPGFDETHIFCVDENSRVLGHYRDGTRFYQSDYELWAGMPDGPGCPTRVVGELALGSNVEILTRNDTIFEIGPLDDTGKRQNFPAKGRIFAIRTVNIEDMIADPCCAGFDRPIDIPEKKPPDGFVCLQEGQLN